MPKNEPLNFTSNWNQKLFCDCFTTFRPNYARYAVGAKFDVLLCSTQNFGEYQIIEKQILKLSEVTEMIAHLDTGYSRDEFVKLIRTMYKNKFPDIENVNFCLLLLKKVKK